MAALATPASGAMPSAFRQQIEMAAEACLDMAHRLIALLDEDDGDPCLESEEPDNTAAEWTGRGAHRFNVGAAA